jgi:hypothetical protein
MYEYDNREISRPMPVAAAVATMTANLTQG